jgi:hypothetical protein
MPGFVPNLLSYIRESMGKGMGLWQFKDDLHFVARTFWRDS